jgi:hypothetical protein
LRAITVVFTFSRARVFSVRISSFVNGRSFKIFFVISIPHAPTFPTNHRHHIPKTARQIVPTRPLEVLPKRWLCRLTATQLTQIAEHPLQTWAT